jgi:hypothetical protein
MIEYPSPGLAAPTGQGAARGMPQLGIKYVRRFPEAWMAILSVPQQKLLRLLITCYPDTMPREELAKETGYSPTSGGLR